MSLFLPKDQPRRLLRLKRFYMALASYAMSSVVFLILLSLEPGLLAPSDILWVLAGVLVIQTYFFWQLRFGDTEWRDDPSMALPQIIVGITWHMSIVLSSSELRDILMFGYIMPMMFGVLALGPVSLGIAAAYAMITYCGIVLIDALYLPARFDAIAEISRLIVLFAMLSWAVLFGGYVSRLRNKLSRRNRELNDALTDIRKLSTRDDLTQAFNRRYMMDALKKEKARCDRGGGTFSVILLDLDHFKSINDQYGHLAGDRVLVTFCDRIRKTLRSMDIMDTLPRSELARYGGEEFIILLPETDLAGALKCAERICSVTRTEPIEDLFNITVSAGVASYVRDEPVEALLQRADQGLYQAKDEGRDRVVTLESLPFDPIDALKDTPEPARSNVVVGHFGASPKDPR